MENITRQIIKENCGSIEDRVAACCDKKVAKYLKQNIYNEIKQNCNNKYVCDFVKQYVEHLIQVRFQRSKIER